MTNSHSDVKVPSETAETQAAPIDAAEANTDISLGSTLPPLMPLSAFVEAQPGLIWSERYPTVTAYLRDSERLVLKFEESIPKLGYHLWRDEELGKQGVWACEEDSKAFANTLVESLAPHLSIFNLEHIVAAFSQHLANEEADRQAAIAKHKAQFPS